MKNPTKAAALAVALLLAMTLSACGDDAPSSSGESTSTQSRTQSSESETPAPLVAESQEPDNAPVSDDEEFLQIVREELPADTVIPDASDDQLLGAAKQACAQMDSGVDVSAVDVIEGEQPNGLGIRESSAKIASAAMRVFCPQGY